MVDLSIENLNELSRIYKNAHRIARAMTLSSSGGIEPETNFMGTEIDLTLVRAAMQNSSTLIDFAANLLTVVSDYVE